MISAMLLMSFAASAQNNYNKLAYVIKNEKKHDTVTARLLVHKLEEYQERHLVFAIDGYVVLPKRSLNSINVNNEPVAYLDEKKRNIEGRYWLWNWKRYQYQCGCE